MDPLSSRYTVGRVPHFGPGEHREELRDKGGYRMELFKMSMQWWLDAWEAQAKLNESVFRSLFSVLPKQQSKEAMALIMNIHSVERTWRQSLRMWLR